MIDENSKITTEVFKHPAQEKATDAFLENLKVLPVVRYQNIFLSERYMRKRLLSLSSGMAF